MEMEGFNYLAGEKDEGVVALVVNLAKAFERVGLPVVRAWGDALQLSKEDVAGAVRVLRRLRGGAAPGYHGHLARVKVELLASTYCVAGRIELGYKSSHAAEVARLCGWYHSTVEGQQQGVGRSGKEGDEEADRRS